LIQPQRGQVRVLGRPVRESRHRIGYVPQAIEFDRAFPIRTRDVVRMGRLHRRGLLHGLQREDDRAVDEALAAVELSDVQREPFGSLSGGQRQRALVARALAVEPDILLLDEPTASVDARVRTSVFELLHRLNERMTILMVTHDMAAVSTYVKTVGCLNRTLHYHGNHELTQAMVEESYQCPVDLIAHGVPHRVLAGHTHTHPTEAP
jgi:zinc transport system ATP-binding protein